MQVPPARSNPALMRPFNAPRPSGSSAGQPFSTPREGGTNQADRTPRPIVRSGSMWDSSRLSAHPQQSQAQKGGSAQGGPRGRGWPGGVTAARSGWPSRRQSNSSPSIGQPESAPYRPPSHSETLLPTPKTPAPVAGWADHSGEWDEPPSQPEPASAPSQLTPSPSPPPNPAQLINASSEAIKRAALRAHSTPFVTAPPAWDPNAVTDEHRLRVENVEARERDPREQLGPSSPPALSSPPPRRKSVELALENISPHARRKAKKNEKRRRRRKEFWDDRELSEITSPDEGDSLEGAAAGVTSKTLARKSKTPAHGRIKSKNARESMSPEVLRSKLAERDGPALRKSRSEPQDDQERRPLKQKSTSRPLAQAPSSELELLPPLPPPGPAPELPQPASQPMQTDLFAAVESKKQVERQEKTERRRQRRQDRIARPELNAPLALSDDSLDGVVDPESSDDALDGDDDEQHPDPSLLCPFCSEPLPAERSARLESVLGYLLAHPAVERKPTRKNAGARHLPLAVHSGFCDLHRNERTVIPQGLARGWPGSVDWAALPRRIDRELSEHVTELVMGDRSSSFLERAKSEWSRKGGKRMRSAANQMVGVEVELPGYYGPRGQDIMKRSLTRNFVDTFILDEHRARPLPVNDYLRRVLIPECAVELIRRDLAAANPNDGNTDDVSYLRAEAEKVMQESKDFGRALHAVDEDEERFWQEEDRKEQEAEARQREEHQQSVLDRITSKRASEQARGKQKQQETTHDLPSSMEIISDDPPSSASSRQFRKPKRALQLAEQAKSQVPTPPARSAKVKIGSASLPQQFCHDVPSAPKPRPPPQAPRALSLLADDSDDELERPRPKAKRIAAPVLTVTSTDNESD